MPQHVTVSPEEDLEAFNRVPPYTRVASAQAPLARTSTTAAPTSTAVAPTAPAPRTPTVAGPSPIIAVILSIVLPGAGEIYVGQVTKGIVLAVVGVPTLGCCGILTLITAADSYLLAQRRQRGETIGDWQFF